MAKKSKQRLFDIEVFGVKEVSRAISHPIDKPLNKGLSESAKRLAAEVRAEAPKRSGKGAKGHQARKRGRFEYIVTDTVAYMGIVRKGSPRHDIFPRRKKALWWPGLAHPVNYVNHPGFKANPYHERALSNAQGVIDKELGLLGGAVVKEWTRK